MVTTEATEETEVGEREREGGRQGREKHQRVQK